MPKTMMAHTPWVTILAFVFGAAVILPSMIALAITLITILRTFM